MNHLHWICFAFELVSLLAYVAVLVTSYLSLRLKPRTSTTLLLTLFTVLATAGGAVYLADRSSISWPSDWFKLIIKGVAAVVIVATSIEIIRLIPRVVEFRDGDQLAAAADELRQSKTRFDRALEGSSCGLWEWNIDDDEVWFAPRFRELLGYSAEGEFPSKFESWKDALHPDDRRRVLDALNEHLQRQGAFDVEYRLRTRSGKHRWFTGAVLPSGDQTGGPT